ncbi:hypothetical protein [Devosia sp.]|uniref:hypothetical protein n=1 Tax=Devosia sp. TaxID=1871048 RepID=UPI002629DCC2|nr:hypothetical protein [Devosia sp.]
MLVFQCVISLAVLGSSIALLVAMGLKQHAAYLCAPAEYLVLYGYITSKEYRARTDKMDPKHPPACAMAPEGASQSPT